MVEKNKNVWYNDLYREFTRFDIEVLCVGGIMDFEEYIKNIWLKEHPLALLVNEIDNETLDTYCLQKINWIEYCLKNECSCKIDKSVIRELFEKIIKYFEMCTFDVSNGRRCFEAPGALFQNLFEICKDSFSFCKEELENMDNLLLNQTVDAFNKIYKEKLISFERILEKNLSWFNFRQVFCNNAQIGFCPLEYYIPYNFYSVFRKEMLALRNTDFDSVFEFARYSLWVYDNAKEIPRQNMFGDIAKFNRFAILCCRNAIVAAQCNGFFEYIELIKNRVRSIQSDIISTPTIFISYNWGKEVLVDEIQNRIGCFAIVKRDKTELGFGDSITEFMNTIRQEDFALIVISDDYLKSDACMYELTTLFEDQGKEKFAQRVLFLICDDARSIYKVEGQTTYVKFWDNKYKKLIALRDTLTPESSVEITKSIRTVSNIRLKIGGFLEYIKSVNNFNETKAIQIISSYFADKYCDGKIGRNVVEDFIIYMRSHASDTEEKG